MTDGDLAHCVSTLCDAPAADAFAYVADAERLGEWTLGCWDAALDHDDVVRGTSLFDGTPTFVRARPAAENLNVDYEVGSDPERLVRRIAVRIVAGDDFGSDSDRSLVILIAWRTESMDDERWRRLTASHEAEIMLLRERIERSATK